MQLVVDGLTDMPQHVTGAMYTLNTLCPSDAISLNKSVDSMRFDHTILLSMAEGYRRGINWKATPGATLNGELAEHLFGERWMCGRSNTASPDVYAGDFEWHL